MLIHSCTPKLAAVKLNWSDVGTGHHPGLLAPNFVIFKASICFVAITLIGLFGSSTDIDYDCQHLKFFLQKGQILQEFLHFLLRTNPSHQITASLVIVKSPLIYRSVLTLKFFSPKVYNKFQVVWLMLLPPPVFTLEILWNSLNIFTGLRVLHWNGSSKSTFMISFSSVQWWHISHKFLEGCFVSGTILYFPVHFQNSLLFSVFFGYINKILQEGTEASSTHSLAYNLEVWNYLYKIKLLFWNSKYRLYFETLLKLKSLLYS